MKIKDIVAREILDSRGNPTVEVDTILESNVIGRYSVPSGASTGSKEALELRDLSNRFNKMGVSSVVDKINNELKYEIIGENNINLNKTIFSEFAKENITIVEIVFCPISGVYM